MVKFIGLMTKKRQEETAPPAAPVETADQKLLREIRDLLSVQKR
jgi:large-conductance mechanosensitive channel